VDGHAATREICRREGTKKRVDIVAMTAEAMEGCRAVCLAAGTDDYIAKPIRVEDLAEALRRRVQWAELRGCGRAAPAGMAAQKRVKLIMVALGATLENVAMQAGNPSASSKQPGLPKPLARRASRMRSVALLSGK
jgi:DNA-binding response OmpR family regulator